jgi:hypothetical protein
MKEYWMQNCLINPSGKKQGFMACDYLGEYVVREIKSMMHNNVNEAHNNFLWNSLSPLILSFRNVRKLMADECDVPYSSMHSTQVSSIADSRTVAQTVVDGRLWEVRYQRPASSATADLHVEGLRKLSTRTPIVKYIAKMQRYVGFIPSAEELFLDLPRGEELDTQEEATGLFSVEDGDGGETLEEGDSWLG